MPGIDPITSIANVVDTVLSRVLPDPQQQAQAKIQMAQMYLNNELQDMVARAGVVTAEASSGNKLTSSWRPMLMYVFMAIIANNYILAPYLQAMFHMGITLQVPPEMWDLLKLGVGGYVMGRSVEKTVQTMTTPNKTDGGTPLDSITNTFRGH